MARRVPVNYILLFTFTACEAYTVAYIAVLYDPATVLFAALLTVAAVSGLTIYAFYTKKDFTSWLAIMTALLCVCLMILCINWFFQFEVLTLFLCALVVALLSIYIIIDT